MSLTGIEFGPGITIGLGVGVGSYGPPYHVSAPTGVTTVGHYQYDPSQTSNFAIRALIALGNTVVGYTVTNSAGATQTVTAQSYNSGTGAWNVTLTGSLAYGNGHWTYTV